MFYRLPPVGNAISVDVSPEDTLELDRLWAPYRGFYFNSGASALAAALLAMVRIKGVAAPEVILPAYACPEVVSAVLYAGAKPVLVDLDPHATYMSLTALTAALTDNTVAVIAIHLFGIPERLPQIHAIIKPRAIFLVEDSAQAFPEQGATLHPLSDAVIFSFGRGKPVSLLGGGVAWVKAPSLMDALAMIHAAAVAPTGSARVTRAKINLYNQFINPRCYWLPDTLPFLKLGATLFRPLDSLAAMDSYRLTLLGGNIRRFWRRSGDVQQQLLERLAGGVILDNIAGLAAADPLPRLLRYPLLTTTPALRERLYQRLHKEGVGVSKLYPAPLPQIEGLQDYFADGNAYPNAASLAACLLTLPVHKGVSDSDVALMAKIVAEEAVGSTNGV